MRNDKSAIVAAALLLTTLAFNLIVLWPQVAIETPTLNDNTLHFTLIERAVEAIDQGQDPTDPWVSYFVQGYPLFHHYQHLPHIITALIYKLLGQAVPLRALFNWINYLLLSAFPLSIYWAGRRLGFGAWQAALAGVIASLLSTNGLYGLDMSSYVWRGYGLYTQLWGMWLLGPALANLYVTLRHGRGYAGTVALLAATLLSHTVLGYVAIASGALLLVSAGSSALGRRSLRLAIVIALVAIVALYFLAPFALDRPYMNRSVWENVGKYNAYGWEWTLSALVKGELLDYGRFPSLTLLAGLGLLICLLRWHKAEKYRWLLMFFGLWLALYFGRPTWGILLNMLPMSQDLHLHRLIAPAHLGAIGLAGVGLAWLWQQAIARKKLWALAAAGALCVCLFAPVYWERLTYLADNNKWMLENVAAFEADGEAMNKLLAKLKTLPPGRVYAGRSANWGKDYRIGSVPVYALLAVNQLDNPGYLYHALSLNADIEGYLDETRPATFSLFNLRYVVAPQNQPAPTFAQPLATYGQHRLYQVDTSGYFDLVDSPLTLYGNPSEWFNATRAWLASPWVEARQHPQIVFGNMPHASPTHAALEQLPALIASTVLSQREPCGQIIGEQITGNTYTVEFKASRACWLLLKQTYHPGWHTQLDNQPVPTAMLAPSFVGIQVMAGQHQAVFTYEAGSLRAWLRVVGLATLILVSAAEWQRQRWAKWVDRLCALAARPWLPLTPRWQQWATAISERWHIEGKWIAAVLALALLAGLPTLQLQQMSGHDALEYLPRAVEFYRNLAEGQLIPQWAPDLSSGYGQPFFIFNPPLIYYLTSFFHLLGINLVASLNLACLALLALAGLGMYLFARQFFGQAGGLAAGAAYMLAPYTLVNLYVRYALADYSAMAFIPWALWGLHCWMGVDKASKKQAGALLAAAFPIALLVLSSNPVALVSAPVMGLYALFLARQKRSWLALGRGALALGLGLGLSAFFWLPALAERHWVKVSNLLGGYLNYRNHFVYLNQLLHSPWGYGLSLPGPEDEMSFGLGVVHLALLALSLLLVRRLRNNTRVKALFWFFVGLLGLAVFLVTQNSIWLWDRLPLLQYLEFPWRILALATCATAFICGFPFLVVRDAGRRRWLLAPLLAGLVIMGLPHAKPQGYYAITDAQYAPAVIAETGIAVTTALEYEPLWVQTRPQTPAPASRLLLLSQQGQLRVLESQLSGTRYNWLVEASAPMQVRIATAYFPGWQLTIDGQSRPLTTQAPFGLMDFTLPAGAHRVAVAFGHTPVRWAGLLISAAALLLAALFAALPALRKAAARP